MQDTMLYNLQATPIQVLGQTGYSLPISTHMRRYAVVSTPSLLQQIVFDCARDTGLIHNIQQSYFLKHLLENSAPQVGDDSTLAEGNGLRIVLLFHESDSEKYDHSPLGVQLS